MKLLNDFFTIIQNSDKESQVPPLLSDDFTTQVKLNSDHFIYKAHFPNNPITPGVCLLQMAQEILEQRIGRQLRLKTAGNIKFRKPVEPTACPTFFFRKLSVQDNTVSVSISVECDDVQLVRMSLMYDIV